MKAGGLARMSWQERTDRDEILRFSGVASILVAVAAALLALFSGLIALIAILVALEASDVRLAGVGALFLIIAVLSAWVVAKRVRAWIRGRRAVALARRARVFD